MKKILGIIFLIFVFVGCSQQKLEKYSNTFYETFDTQIIYLEYAKSESEYNENYNFVKSEFERLHKLYDNYRTYNGITNIKSINDTHKGEWIKVDKDIFDLINFSVENYEKTHGKVNVAMGSVLKIWHDVREKNQGTENTILPNENELKEAAKHTNIKDIELDKENLAIKINDPKLIIDFGATAKGYATELVAKKLMEKGVTYASINAGGNVKTLGKHPERNTWGIALQNPDTESSEFLEVLFLEGETSVVTSGDYQRYFMHNGKKYDHIIDPETNWPNPRFRSVSIITKDSGLADLLSTALYLSDKDEALEILKNFEDEVGVVWATDEGKDNTPNMDDKMQSKGAVSR